MTLSKSEIFVVIVMKIIRRVSLWLWRIKAVRVLVMCLLVLSFIRFIIFPIFEWWDRPSEVET